MLDATQLAAMRATTVAALPDTCSLIVVTPASGPYGGADTLATRSSGVACRLAPGVMGGSGGERVEDERLVGREPWVITLPHDTNVATAAGESLRVTSGSRSFEVVDATADQSWELATRVQLVRRAT